MREIFEKETEKEVAGEVVKEISECAEKDATHKHYCYHDEPRDMGQCRPCKRIKL